MPKVAVVMGGLLGCHKFAIDSIMRNVVIPNNADVFILTARRNYIHASSDKFDCRNVELDVTKNDEDVIVNCFGHNLKALRYSEDIPEYVFYLQSQIDQLRQRVAWIEGGNLRIERYDVERKTIIDGERYIDQFVRQRFLVQFIEDYEKANGFNYDYIIRLRIDQPIDKQIIPLGSEGTLWWNGMDNCFYGTTDVMKRIGREFVENIGRYNVESYKNLPGGDYRLTPEMQFIGFIRSLSANVKQSYLGICWRFYKQDSTCTVFDYGVSEATRINEMKTTQEFYKFEPCQRNPYYSVFDTDQNVIWVYCLLDHAVRFKNEV